MTDQYASVSVTMMNAGYATLDSEDTAVTTAGHQRYVLQSIVARAGSAIGSITLYGEGISRFDACTAEQQQ